MVVESKPSHDGKSEQLEGKFQRDTENVECKNTKHSKFVGEHEAAKPSPTERLGQKRNWPLFHAFGIQDVKVAGNWKSNVPKNNHNQQNNFHRRCRQKMIAINRESMSS
eukprot:INCI19023.1.p2 GENE.INCI19023.1~~INCI19023.1.p2  ORF type:complete len:109 (-),score=26.04 INCI19023.1:194-520(-)